ncbi:MAG TPA: zf-TFIIB domain-containing protein [Thermoanaerobaculia bacterium]|nr:zf-TFIIB domain-containing protein [Thermoanaerobaculia bacterium]
MSDGIDKPSKAEDEYFAKQEIERRKRWAKEQAEKNSVDEMERIKQLHFMKCPKCGFDLHTIEFHGVKVDQCGHCGGIFFDQGEIEQLLQHEAGIMGRVMSIFR